jgi:hypothetical protein
LIDSLQGDRVGLVVFAGAAGELPLTIDQNAVKRCFSTLSARK